MLPTFDRDTFVTSPSGRCLVRPSFAVWCAAPDLQGSILWGALDEPALCDLLAIGQQLSGQRRTLTDLHEISRADANVLLGFVMTARTRSWARGIERQALLVPTGVTGMMLSGALALGADHEVRSTDDLATALAFVDDPRARDAHAEATAIVAATRGRSALLARLRVELDANLDSATIDGCARALAMSSRTLQRELQQLATSFSDELRNARIAAAEALLVHTDRKIDAIAVEVGYGSASRLSAYLRKAFNVTASELRSAART